MPEDPRRPQDALTHLRQMPVVLFSDVDLLPVVRAGVMRAGHDPSTIELPDAGAEALADAVAGGAEVGVAVLTAQELIPALHRVRQLGGRALPILGLHGGDAGVQISEASRSLLGDPVLSDLNVPVPAIADDAVRRSVWDLIRSAGMEDRHHVVEVDGKPALDELLARGVAPPKDRWRALAAGAAGVLAGRLAAGNRRWRDPLER